MNNQNYFNIVAIDPGTTHLGVAVYSVEIDSLQIMNSTAFTIDVSKLNCENWTSDVHGQRFYRILEIKERLLWVFNTYCPTIICCESPFFGMRHPGAYQALTELLTLIRQSVFEYDQWRSLRLVPPSNVKQAVGQKGNADKAAMKSALLQLKDTIKYNPAENIDMLDEHSIDALAVGYWAYCDLLTSEQRK